MNNMRIKILFLINVDRGVTLIPIEEDQLLQQKHVFYLFLFFQILSHVNRIMLIEKGFGIPSISQESKDRSLSCCYRCALLPLLVALAAWLLLIALFASPVVIVGPALVVAPIAWPLHWLLPL